MKNVLMIVFASMATMAAGQNSETRSLGSFKGVSVSESVSVYLQKGDKESARVEVSGTSASNVLTEVSGSYLKVHMRDGNYRNANAKVYVTYVSLEKLSASAAGNIYASESIKSDDMEISVSSAGNIEVVVDAGDLEISASSAGDMELKGKAKRLTVEVSSAGDINAYDLEAETVDATANSAGSAKVSVTKELEAEANSGGTVRYRGNPDKSITDSSSGGSVKKSN